MSLIGDELAESSDPNKLAADMREPCPQCAILLSRVTAYDSLLALVREEREAFDALDSFDETSLGHRKYYKARTAIHQWLDEYLEG